ncbi:hypothetical protein NW755_007916 [Fusarium falciforme]|uniref:Uncharacterized protein n=1 Tax=Fusarium falciforme TaxID=195108 RepID=A0A9W8R5U0_9HYPO|nr:hypothetical protein NW755_007916 [Fusarium falciforme]KAJ4254100.1 hypothetical protein NW757_005247 [Fusarium falciforme]
MLSKYNPSCRSCSKLSLSATLFFVFVCPGMTTITIETWTTRASSDRLIPKVPLGHPSNQSVGCSATVVCLLLSSSLPHLCSSPRAKAKTEPSGTFTLVDSYSSAAPTSHDSMALRTLFFLFFQSMFDCRVVYVSFSLPVTESEQVPDTEAGVYKRELLL